jgi:hypothetical protein
MLNFSNFVRTTLRTPVTPTDTMLLLEAGSAALFSLSAGDYCYVTVSDSATVEIMKYTSIGPVINDTIPVMRGQDGTTPKAFPAGACVQVAWNKAQVSDFVVQLYNDMFDAALLGSDTIQVTATPTAPPPGGVYYAVKVDTHQMWYWDLNTPAWIELGNISQGVVVTTSPPSAPPAANVRFAINTSNGSLYYWNNGTWLQISSSAGAPGNEVWTRKTTHTTAITMPANIMWDPSHFGWTDDVRWQANPALPSILAVDAKNDFKLTHDAIIRVSCGVNAARTAGGECIGTLVLVSDDPTLVQGEWGVAWNFEVNQSQPSVVLNATTTPIKMHANTVLAFNIINDQISQPINIAKIYFSIEVLAQQ